MNKFKNGDMVLIINGKHRTLSGKVVDNEGPVIWIKLTTTKEVVNVYESDAELLDELRELVWKQK